MFNVIMSTPLTTKKSTPKYSGLTIISTITVTYGLQQQISPAKYNFSKKLVMFVMSSRLAGQTCSNSQGAVSSNPPGLHS